MDFIPEILNVFFLPVCLFIVEASMVGITMHLSDQHCLINGKSSPITNSVLCIQA
jgi:hypothetical protein